MAIIFARLSCFVLKTLSAVRVGTMPDFSAYPANATPGKLEVGHTKEPGTQLQCSEAHLFVAEAPNGGRRKAERRDAKAQRGQRIHRDVVLCHLDDDLQTWQPSPNVQAGMHIFGTGTLSSRLRSAEQACCSHSMHPSAAHGTLLAHSMVAVTSVAISFGYHTAMCLRTALWHHVRLTFQSWLESNLAARITP